MFTSVISDLEASYPKEKLDEISTSFCFICLLHLANERGLKIEGGTMDVDNVTATVSDGEDTFVDLPVSNIWGLKVRSIMSFLLVPYLFLFSHLFVDLS